MINLLLDRLVYYFGSGVPGYIAFVTDMLIFTISLSFHEFAHAFTAYKMGDYTARLQGRMTLNPAKHLTVLGTLALFVAGFGWARPVPVNPFNFRKRKRAMVLVSLAGPVSNLLLAFVSLLIYFLSVFLRVTLNFEIPPYVAYVDQFVIQMVSINVTLAVFNLIPISPLDGSKILGAVLPSRLYMKLLSVERYGYFILIAALYLGLLDGVISWCSNGIIFGMLWLANIIFGLGIG